MTARVVRFGLDRNFSTEHYPADLNAFQVARLHKPIPAGYPLQRDAKGRIMKKGEGEVIAPVETPAKPKRLHRSTAQRLALEAKERARHEASV